MESSLNKHILELNKLSYNDQSEYIEKKKSMEPDDITHLTFFKKLHIIITDECMYVCMYVCMYIFRRLK